MQVAYIEHNGYQRREEAGMVRERCAQVVDANRKDERHGYTRE